MPKLGDKWEVILSGETGSMPSKGKYVGEGLKKKSSNEFTGEIFICTINACSGTKKIGEIKIY